MTFIHQILSASYLSSFFFFTDTATTEIYTLSLHDALPICEARCLWIPSSDGMDRCRTTVGSPPGQCGPEEIPRSSDRKSTRLNSSHTVISYAVFCLKKKKKKRKKTKTNTQKQNK